MITIDDLGEMAKDLPEESISLIKRIVGVMVTLRNMDTEEIDRLLSVHKMAINIIPPEMKVAVEAMISDLTLAKVFAEQAKAYDKTDIGMKAFESIFGEVK